MIDLLLVEFYSKLPCFLLPGEQLQETTCTYLQRGTETKGTLKRAKPEEDYSAISKEQVEASSEPSTFNNWWRMGNITEVREE